MIFNTFAHNNYDNPNTALVYKDKNYSYKEIIDQVSLLKNLFKGQNNAGLIYLPKNEYLIILLLALNASGNVFSMLDITTPKDRALEVISQLKPKWIISLEDFSTLGFNKIQIKKNLIKESYKIWTTESYTAYDKKISHIYFSSGSTGKPKGILLTPEPLIDVVIQQAQMIGMNSDKKFAWLLSPSFDASLSDIFTTLFSGAQLHICDFTQNKIKTVIKYFTDNKITHSDISPSVLPLFKNNTLFLESIIFGGEISNENTIKELAKTMNMFNAYGPTETSICSSLKKVDNDWTANNIGKPLMRVCYYISEDNELYISGNHLCIGYLDTQLNFKKFVIKNNIRYYKTGDLVEYKNGEYFYLGRIDKQFKNNGVLISPEEIESIAILAGCIQAKCTNIDKFTLFYKGSLENKELRNFLEKKLNKNMIPNVLIKVKSFDTNINGKTFI